MQAAPLKPLAMGSITRLRDSAVLYGSIENAVQDYVRIRINTPEKLAQGEKFLFQIGSDPEYTFIGGLMDEAAIGSGRSLRFRVLTDIVPLSL